MNQLPRLTLFSCLLLAACGDPEPANEAANVTAPTAAAEANAVIEANASAAVPANAAEAAVPVVNLAPDGLTLVLEGGASRHAAFELPRDVVVGMVSSALGKSTAQGRNEECGAGALDTVDFKDGLTLYFQEGQFAGWELDGDTHPKYSTANGIAIGSTRKQLEAAGPLTVEDSTLGHEFQAGELSGLLSSKKPDGKVTLLWAGVSCFFR